MRKRSEEDVTQFFIFGVDARFLGLIGALGALQRTGDHRRHGLEHQDIGAGEGAVVVRRDTQYAECLVFGLERQIKAARRGQGVGVPAGDLAVGGHPLHGSSLADVHFMDIRFTFWIGDERCIFADP